MVCVPTRPMYGVQPTGHSGLVQSGCEESVRSGSLQYCIVTHVTAAARPCWHRARPPSLALLFPCPCCIFPLAEKLFLRSFPVSPGIGA